MCSQLCQQHVFFVKTILKTKANTSKGDKKYFGFLLCVLLNVI